MFTYGLTPVAGDSTPLTLAAQTVVAGKEYVTLNTVPAASAVGAAIYGAFTPIKFSSSTTTAELILRAGAAYSGTALSFRLGIYSDNNGVPGALLIDAGTITWSSIILGQVKSIACSQALSANTLYWVAVGCSYSSGAPSIQTTNATNKPFTDLGLAGETGASGYYFNHNGANALPDPAPTITNPTNLFPRVYVKLAS